MLGGALGSSIPIFQRLFANRGEKVSNVAFQVELPALNGLSTAQLIDVRLKYEDTFTRFRNRLRVFLEECIRQRVARPEDVRAKLKADLIDGELEELRSDLEQAGQALKRKSAYALSLNTYDNSRSCDRNYHTCRRLWFSRDGDGHLAGRGSIEIRRREDQNPVRRHVFSATGRSTFAVT
jgi:hypothetical protein